MTVMLELSSEALTLPRNVSKTLKMGGTGSCVVPLSLKSIISYHQTYTETSTTDTHKVCGRVPLSNFLSLVSHETMPLSLIHARTHLKLGKKKKSKKKMSRFRPADVLPCCRWLLQPDTIPGWRCGGLPTSGAHLGAVVVSTLLLRWLYSYCSKFS